MLAGLVLVGCSGGVTSDRSARSTGTATGLGTGGSGSGTGSNATGGLLTQCSNGTSAVGYVTPGSPTTGTFRDSVAGLISATVNPSQLGSIANSQPDASTGVDVQLHLALSNGQLNVSGSQLQLTIYDSFVGTMNSDGTQVMPITLGLSPAVSGQVNQSSRTFNITFSDSYGSVTLQGAWNDSTVQGTISYSNTQNAAGGSPASGMLGNFLAPTCGVF